MPTKMYHISGMHCNGCVNSIKNVLGELPGVLAVQVQLNDPQAIISMREDLPVKELQQELSAAGDYVISEIAEPAEKPASQKRSLFGNLGNVFHRKDCCK